MGEDEGCLWKLVGVISLFLRSCDIELLWIKVGK